ncbi:SDR family oxidoreductase [Paenibacillus larvae]
MQVQDKIAVITGASSGLGAEIARQLAGKGAIPLLLARNQAKLEEVTGQLATTAYPYLLDITEDAGVEAVFQCIYKKHGRIDILINNAGFGIFHSFLDIPLDQFKQMMDVNYMGIVRCTKAVLPHMLRQGSGHIVNIASMAGKIGSAKSTAYSASKHAVLGFTNSLRAELAGTGIGLTAVNPGPIDTPFFDIADPEGNYVKNISWFMLKPEKAVNKTIQAIEKNKSEVNLPFLSAAGIKLFHLFPGLFERIAYKLLNKK